MRGSLCDGYEPPFRSCCKHCRPLKPCTTYSQASSSQIRTSSPDLPNWLFHVNLDISSVNLITLKRDSSPPRTPTSLSGGLPKETAWPPTRDTGQNPEPPRSFRELPKLSCPVCSAHLEAVKAATVPEAVASARPKPPLLTCLAAMTSHLVSGTHSTYLFLTPHKLFFNPNPSK